MTNYFVRVILTSAIAAMIVTIPAVLVNRWEGWPGIASGIVVAFFALFLVATIQHLSHKDDAEESIRYNLGLLR